MMPLLDHFHPPFHGPRRSEGFHHAWATFIAKQLNTELPEGYFAESEISVGPEMEIDVAALEDTRLTLPAATSITVASWAPPEPAIREKISFARLDSYEVRVDQDDGGGAQLRAAIELISPANKDRPGSRQTFAAKCAGYLQHGIGLAIVDVVTLRTANLHADLFNMLEVSSKKPLWESITGLYAISYRPVVLRKAPRLEAWPQPLEVGQSLPDIPLWLSLELCLPVRLEASYRETCESLRISA